MTATSNALECPENIEEHVARLPETVYSSTAFIGDFDEAPARHSTWWVKDYLENNTRCHEYLVLNQTYEVGELCEWKERYFKQWTKAEANYNQRQYLNHGSDLPAAYHFWSVEFTLLGFLEVMQFLALMGSFMSIGSPILGSFLMMDLYWVLSIFYDPVLLTIHLVPILLFFAVKALIKSGIPSSISKTPRPTISFHRNTGMVKIRRRMKTKTFPFREMQGAAFTTYDPHSKLKRLAFGIKHKHSSAWATMEGNLTASTPLERWTLNLRWEFLTHFMDVSRPLPDVPMLEPFRHLDPTTREWDKKNGRDKTIWLNMSNEAYKSLCSAALESAKQYPYNKSNTKRSQWKPAGDGKHWYQLG